MLSEKLTNSDIIYQFLYKNGKQKAENIYKHVKTIRATVSKGSINATLWNNRHVFTNRGYGVWDLLTDSKTEREQRVLYKLILLMKHYQEILEKLGIKAETTLAGVEFSQDEEQIIDEIYRKYKKD